MSSTSGSLRQNLMLSVAALLAVVLVGEVVLRCIYFQKKSSNRSAWLGAGRAVAIKTQRAKYRAENARYKGAWEALFSEPGEVLLDSFEKRYRAHFEALVSSVRKVDAKFVLLYIPSVPPDSPMSVSESWCRPFFRKLAAENEISFLDVTPKLRSRDWTQVTLLPEDGHLSRYGCRLVADELSLHLDGFRSYRSQHIPEVRPSSYGDLKPSRADVWEIDHRMPYRVITNRQGFRNVDDLSATKQRQRVLLLGDSFTFGAFLPNHDTFPAQLQKGRPDLEVVNGGVGGYTITSQVSLFIERARYIAPDVVVLQVLDNDIFELFAFKLNRFDRRGQVFEPSELEEDFLKQIARRNAP